MEAWRFYQLNPGIKPDLVRKENGVLYWAWPDGFKVKAISGGGPANSVQQTHRFRNDDGNEADATFMGAGNGEDATVDADTIFRLRVVVEETAGGTDNIAAGLQYSLNGAGYLDVTGATPIQAAASAYDPDPQDDQVLATARLGYSGTMEDGRFDDDGVDTTAVGIDADNTNYTEFEFCLTIPTGALSDQDWFDLRVYDAGGALDAYTDTPRVTVSIGAATLEVDETESITVTDTPALALAIEPIAESESIGSSENVEISADRATDETENIEVTESVSLSISTLTIDVNDNVGIADTPLMSMDVEPIVESDSIGLSESVEVAVIRAIEESESISVTDTPALTISTLTIDVNDSITITESVNASIPTAAYEIAVSDSISIADIAHYPPDLIAVTESVDVSLVGVAYTVNESDSITITENIVVTTGTLTIDVSDSIGITESVDLDLTRAIVEVESIEGA